MKRPHAEEWIGRRGMNEGRETAGDGGLISSGAVEEVRGGRSLINTVCANISEQMYICIYA